MDTENVTFEAIPKDNPIYTEPCKACKSGDLILLDYGDDAVCDHCDNVCETDYEDHDEIPGGYTEIWIFQED